MTIPPPIRSQWVWSLGKSLGTCAMAAIGVVLRFLDHFPVKKKQIRVITDVHMVNTRDCHVKKDLLLTGLDSHFSGQCTKFND